MSSIVVAILAFMCIPMTSAVIVIAIRGARSAVRTGALAVRHVDRDDDRLFLELSVVGRARWVRVEAITIDRAFAGRVLAQPPAGFARRRVAPDDGELTWTGRFRVHHGAAHTLAIPMRTDIAATGSLAFVYSYRSGPVKRTSCAAIDYRPLLIAIGA